MTPSLWTTGFQESTCLWSTLLFLGCAAPTLQVAPVPPVERLKQSGIEILPAQNPIQPDIPLKAALKRTDFFVTKQQHISILIFEFTDQTSARESRKAVLKWATKPEKAILFYPKLMNRGNFLLLIGTSTSKPLAPKTSRTIATLQQSFES